MVECGSCPVQDCGSDDCPDPDHEERDTPCGVCEFLQIGGVPTLAPFSVDAIDWVAVDGFAEFLAHTEWTQCEAEDAASRPFKMGSFDGRLCPSLYTRLVSTSLPTRAPNTSFVS